MTLRQHLLPALAIVLIGCGNTSTGLPISADPGATAAPDGITLTSATPARLTGSYADAAGNLLRFDAAKVDDTLYFDLTGIDGRAIIHIETVGDNYEFSYMGGALKMHTTKAFVAQARAQAEVAPDAVSTDGFVFDGDTHALDEMLQLPEMAQLPALSRALGARGITGSEFPAALVLHKAARQSAEALGVQLQKLDTAQSLNSYCSAYPNSGDSCYGMCGSGCSCWSWVCGDCCYHYGCAVHDSWCRAGQWWYCYNITAVIALFGC
jgi:hypothetical protein